MATVSDSQAVFGIVLDAIRVLDWSAGEESRLVRADGESVPVLARELVQTYRAALEQAHRSFFELALRTLSGENINFPLTAVLAELERAGWTGPLREFKVRVLELSGRPQVMEVANRGRQGGGRIRSAIFRRFLDALNHALDSLGAIPGVDAIKELKGFEEIALTT